MDPIASPTKQISKKKQPANGKKAPSCSISKTRGFFVSKIRWRNRWRNPLKSPVILPNHRVFMGGIYPQNEVSSSFFVGWDSPNMGIYLHLSKEPSRTNSAASGALLRGKSTRSTREAGGWTCFIRKFSCKQRLPGKTGKKSMISRYQKCVYYHKFSEEFFRTKKTHVTCCVIVVCFLLSTKISFQWMLAPPSSGALLWWAPKPRAIEAPWACETPGIVLRRFFFANKAEGQQLHPNKNGSLLKTTLLYPLY